MTHFIIGSNDLLFMYQNDMDEGAFTHPERIQ
jgi:hypothetical protein